MIDEGSQQQPRPGVQAHPGPGVHTHAEALPGPPDEAMLGATQPMKALPSGAVPGGAVPDGAAPGGAVPGGAVPSEPPKVGVDAVGTIPQTSAARIWGREQASNWRLYLIRFLVAGIAVVVTVALLPGLRFRGWEWGEFVQIAVIFGVLNVTVKPLLQFLSLRFILNTYGLVVVLVNTVVLALLGLLMPDRFQAERPIALLAGGLVVGVLGLVLETLLGANQPVLDREYRERNGMA